MTLVRQEGRVSPFWQTGKGSPGTDLSVTGIAFHDGLDNRFDNGFAHPELDRRLVITAPMDLIEGSDLSPPEHGATPILCAQIPFGRPHGDLALY
jgi:hypothetical protein